jgi:hypothetical protein
MSTGDQAANKGIFGDMEDLFPELVTPPNHNKPPPATPQFTGTAAGPGTDRTVSMYPDVSLGDGVTLDELDVAMGFDKLTGTPPPLNPPAPRSL